MTAENNTCDRCSNTQEGIGWFANAYRKLELRKGRPDPGNLCGGCAGGDTGRRIASELCEPDTPSTNGACG